MGAAASEGRAWFSPLVLLIVSQYLTHAPLPPGRRLSQCLSWEGTRECSLARREEASVGQMEWPAWKKSFGSFMFIHRGQRQVVEREGLFHENIPERSDGWGGGRGGRGMKGLTRASLACCRENPGVWTPPGSLWSPCFCFYEGGCEQPLLSLPCPPEGPGIHPSDGAEARAPLGGRWPRNCSLRGRGAFRVFGDSQCPADTPT